MSEPTRRDAVDDILEAWQRERPDLDVLPLAILSRISRLARRLDLARRDAFAEHDLELWEFDVLAALRRAGAPYELSPGSLVAETMVTSGTMTNRVDRLVAKHLVTRRSDPSDRRAVRVRLTESGATVVDAAFEGLLAYENQILAGLDEHERLRLADLLRTMGTALGA